MAMQRFSTTRDQLEPNSVIRYLRPKRVHFGLCDLMPRERTVVSAIRHAYHAAVGGGQATEGIETALADEQLEATAPTFLWMAMGLAKSRTHLKRGLDIRSVKSPILGVDELSLLNAIAAMQDGQAMLASAVIAETLPPYHRRHFAALRALSRQLSLAGCILNGTGLQANDATIAKGPWQEMPVQVSGKRKQ